MLGVYAFKGKFEFWEFGRSKSRVCQFKNDFLWGKPVLCCAHSTKKLRLIWKVSCFSLVAGREGMRATLAGEERLLKRVADSVK